MQSTVNHQSSTINHQILGAQTGSKTIALFGDSMIDTMGTNTPALSAQLTQMYPNMQFNILNYGIGAQTAPQATQRINQPYSYKDRNYSALTQSNADIYIIGSFAYNPIDNIDEYKNSLTQILQAAQQTGKPVYFLATIAPLKANFGSGPNGVNWDTDTAWQHATTIQNHMEAGIAIAQSLGIPIIDAYHPTLHENGEGIANFVSQNDGIHPSEAGHQFIARKIAEVIQL